MFSAGWQRAVEFCMTYFNARSNIKIWGFGRKEKVTLEKTGRDLRSRGALARSNVPTHLLDKNHICSYKLFESSARSSVTMVDYKSSLYGNYSSRVWFEYGLN